MHRIILLIQLILVGKINAQPSKTFELSGHINSVDKIIPLGNLHTVDSKILDGGNFTNNSFAIGITGKYFIKENLSLYLKGIFAKRIINDFRELVYINGRNTLKYHINQNLFKISPGIQWSLPYKHFSFLAGIELPLTLYGNATQLSNYFEEDQNGSNKVYQDILIRIPGGVITGIGFWIGSNCYFSSKFAIGFSIGSAYQYTSVGGEIYFRADTSPAVVESPDIRTHNETIKQLGFASLQSSVTVTWVLK